MLIFLRVFTFLLFLHYSPDKSVVKRNEEAKRENLPITFTDFLFFTFSGTWKSTRVNPSPTAFLKECISTPSPKKEMKAKLGTNIKRKTENVMAWISLLLLLLDLLLPSYFHFFPEKKIQRERNWKRLNSFAHPFCHHHPTGCCLYANFQLLFKVQLICSAGI